MSCLGRKRTRTVFRIELLEEEEEETLEQLYVDQQQVCYPTPQTPGSGGASPKPKNDRFSEPPAVMSLSSGGIPSPRRRRGGGWDGGSRYPDRPLHDAKTPLSSGNRTHRRVTASTTSTRRVFVVPPQSRPMKRTRRHPSRNSLAPGAPSYARAAHRDEVRYSNLEWCAKHRDLVTPTTSDLQGKRLSADPRCRSCLLSGPLDFLFPEWKLQEIDRMDRSRRANLAFAAPCVSLKQDSPLRNAVAGNAVADIPVEQEGAGRRKGSPKFTWLSQDHVVQRLDWVSRDEDLEGFRLGGKLKGKKLGYSGFWEVDTLKDDFACTLAC